MQRATHRILRNRSFAPCWQNTWANVANRRSVVVDHIRNSASASNTTAVKRRRSILSCLPAAEVVGLSFLARIILSTSRPIEFRPFNNNREAGPRQSNFGWLRKAGPSHVCATLRRAWDRMVRLGGICRGEATSTRRPTRRSTGPSALAGCQSSIFPHQIGPRPISMGRPASLCA